MNKFITSVTILVALAMVTLAHEPSPEVKAAIESCKGKFPNVKDDVIKKMCTPDFDTTDMDTKCFQKCLGDTLGYLDASGKLVAEKIKANPPPGVEASQVDAFVQECAAKAGTDPCDTSFQQWKCLMSKKKM